MSISAVLFATILTTLLPLVRADDSMNMNMTTDGAMAMTMPGMLPYLHFTPGDTVLFLGWAPGSNGAMVGACIALFVLALLDRGLAAIRASVEHRWQKRTQLTSEDKFDSSSLPSGKKQMAQVTVEDKSDSSSLPVAERSTQAAINRRHVPPFVLSHAVVRGILYLGQATLMYTFMLVIMTFQAAFVISIILGLGVGEMLFGHYLSWVYC
ncbi:hypothetical protein GALMADRAFT_133684 [Galerina marginata CBS 339.88]|uniref:Copper transport protein n=1 Tax=Galerina marginata (strain CBS 339.88) TaxID=685588 RepID=A0A067TMH2_GALM3|nr:hypothetical protein GALMADRAFT_133684 [Galerina marginata CBS 339.88]